MSSSEAELVIDYREKPDGYFVARNVVVRHCPVCGKGAVRATERRRGGQVLVTYSHKDVLSLDFKNEPKREIAISCEEVERA